MTTIVVGLLLLWLVLALVVWWQQQRLERLEAHVTLLLTPTTPPPVLTQARILARLREIEGLLRTFVQQLDGMERDVAAALREDPHEPRKP